MRAVSSSSSRKHGHSTASLSWGLFSPSGNPTLPPPSLPVALGNRVSSAVTVLCFAKRGGLQRTQFSTASLTAAGDSLEDCAEREGWV